ncbi:hypothetical protein DPMN_190572 [Dreissena polymorpha]|uniref:Uncharacterized protein n=1 Tax=Dreissena polymorpha TaxID=45954 RepID=A0A9D4IDG6_DREPO|nr:hypothetical protein DPMN_190572 [Dreissena polymorpha]
MTPQFAPAKSPCSTVYPGEIVIVHSGLNHGDAMWMAEIALDIVYLAVTLPVETSK